MNAPKRMGRQAAGIKRNEPRRGRRLDRGTASDRLGRKTGRRSASARRMTLPGRNRPAPSLRRGALWRIVWRTVLDVLGGL